MRGDMRVGISDSASDIGDLGRGGRPVAYMGPGVGRFRGVDSLEPAQLAQACHGATCAIRSG